MKAVDREVARARCRDYYKKNRQKILIQQSEYRKANPEKVAALQSDYALKNAERLKAYKSEWHVNNRDKARASFHRRRSNKAGNGFERYTETQVLESYGVDCHLCGRPIDLTAPRYNGFPGWQYGLHIDHVIPLSRGGSDTLENVRPSHGVCNLKKGAHIGEQKVS